jgi:hypothetical protein
MTDASKRRHLWASTSAQLRDVLAFLVQARHDVNGRSQLWYRQATDGTVPPTYICLLCDQPFVPPKGFSSATGLHAAHYAHRQSQGHDALAKRILDEDLRVPGHTRQQRLRRIAISRKFADINVHYLDEYSIYIGPEWFDKLAGSWTPDMLIRKVLRRALEDATWRDALSAAAAIPDDTEAIDVLVAGQYPEEFWQ